METTITEKLDTLRYRLIKWMIIGWTFGFGIYISKDFITRKIVVLPALLLGLFAWILFTVNLIKFVQLGKVVNSDIKLKQALNNELILFNAHKSFRIGFFTVMALVCIFFAITLFYSISAIMVCEITLYIGVLTPSVAALIYNKN